MALLGIPDCVHTVHTHRGTNTSALKNDERVPKSVSDFSAMMCPSPGVCAHMRAHDFCVHTIQALFLGAYFLLLFFLNNTFSLLTLNTPCVSLCYVTH